MVTKVHMLVDDQYPVYLRREGSAIIAAKEELDGGSVIGIVRSDSNLDLEFSTTDLHNLAAKVFVSVVGVVASYGDLSELNAVLRLLAQN